MQPMMALMPAKSVADMEAEAKSRSDELQNQEYIQGLAAHARTRWEESRDAKQDLEERMLQCVRQRNGEYDPDVRAEIEEQGGSDIFVQLTSVKCRAATSWLRDTLLGTGNDKPWAIEATPQPELPEEVLQSLQAQLSTEIMNVVQQTGQMPSEEELRQIALSMKDEAMNLTKEEANERVKRMELKMEDQLLEGNWFKAFNEFIDDIVTFPFAAIKGPVKRRRKVMKWEGGALVPKEEIKNEWERVDPFNLYWAPWAWDINDGYVIERHRMTREDLQSLIGVPGYNEDAIRTVLADFGTGQSGDWFGHSVFISGDYVVVGAYQEDQNGRISAVTAATARGHSSAGTYHCNYGRVGPEPG